MAVVVLCALAGGVTGCVNADQRQGEQAVQAYYSGDYSSAMASLKPLAEKTNGDFVLNNVRLGSVALVAYRLDDAEAAFLRAYEVINSVGVNEGGRSVGAVLVDEKIKVWKGEPFERAMVNFYLGLVYYMRHDYNNARAAFENALFKLRDYEDKDDKSDKYRDVESDFALGYLMLGKSYQRLGRDDLAKANFARAVQLRPYLAAAADWDRNQRSNLLLVVDYGYGPHKQTDFDGAIVGFAPLPAQEGPVPQPVVFVDGHQAHIADVAQPPVDLLALAQDRRWQSIDTIRTVKSALGTGMIVGGAGYGIYSSGRHGGMRGSDALISAGLIGTGLLLKATSQADTRQWEMLPRTTYVLPLYVPPGTHEVTVTFPSSYGLAQTWRNLPVPEQGEATYYIRMQRWDAAPHTWPPPAMAPPAPVAAAAGPR
jgi:tetratricopeptide (TPR) repeat protein